MVCNKLIGQFFLFCLIMGEEYALVGLMRVSCNKVRGKSRSCHAAFVPIIVAQLRIIGSQNGHCPESLDSCIHFLFSPKILHQFLIDFWCDYMYIVF